MVGFEFRAPTRILTGRGSARNAGAEMHATGARHVLVVSDPFILAGHAARAVLTALSESGLRVTTFDRVDGEPTVRVVDAAHAAAVDAGVNGVVGLGGGSAMDVAKAVAILATHGGPLVRFEGADRVPSGRLPLACIATTAGTGSEATRYLIVTDEARDRKMLVSTWACLPDIAIADPDLTRHVPTRAAVAAGIDAFTHALEAYVSRRAQPLTDGLALTAIRRIVPALPRVVADPTDDDAREAMSTGALEAGIAFANASVALVHGMARPLGARFGVAHGMANAVLLPIVCDWSWHGAPRRYREVGVAMGAVSDANSSNEVGARATVEAIARFCGKVGVPSMAGLGVPEDAYTAAIPAMAVDALASGSPANNPRLPEATDLEALYRVAYTQ
jgi:alcohol dehydrogenase class IV